MPESTERSFPSCCCPGQNKPASWYAATSPGPSPRPKEALHRGAARWEGIRTAGISGGIKSAILLHSTKWNLAGERDGCQQSLFEKIQTGPRAGSSDGCKHWEHASISLSRCSALRLGCPMRWHPCLCILAFHACVLSWRAAVHSGRRDGSSVCLVRWKWDDLLLAFFFYPCLFYCGSFGWASIEGGEVGVMSVFSHSPFLQAALGRISRLPVLKVIVGSF